MAAVTADAVLKAKHDGHAAGYSLLPSSPNPYAPPHVPPWRMPRDPAVRAELDRRTAAAQVLARVWRDAYRDGQTAYANEHGLPITVS